MANIAVCSAFFRQDSAECALLRTLDAIVVGKAGECRDAIGERGGDVGKGTGFRCLGALARGEEVIYVVTSDGLVADDGVSDHDAPIAFVLLRQRETDILF